MKVTPVASRRFRDVGTDEAETRAFLEHLDERGYAVAASVATPDDVASTRSEFWDFLEGYRGLRDGQRDTGVRRDDPETWSDYDDDGRRQWMGSASTGIIGGNGVGQAPFMWRVRSLPAVARVFGSIWDVKEDELLVSFDGANAFRPWKYDADWKTRGGWYHVDQNGFNPGKEGRCCVQGLVLLTDADGETGGLVVVPGSHQHFMRVCFHNVLPKPGMDFFEIDGEDEVFEQCGGEGRLVCGKAGDLIVWDSRTIHCNSPALAKEGETEEASSAEEQSESSHSLSATPEGGWELLRMVAYICMTPSSWATSKVLSKRWDAYVHNLTTNHWPHEFVGDTTRPNLCPNDPTTLSVHQKHLIGGNTGEFCEPPQSVLGSLKSTDAYLTEDEREARELLDLAEETEAKGNHLGAIQLYKQAYKLDPTLEFT